MVREAPFHVTTDDATKPLPLTVSVRLALPAVAPVGDRLPATGTPGTDGVVERAGIDKALHD